MGMNNLNIEKLTAKLTAIVKESVFSEDQIKEPGVNVSRFFYSKNQDSAVIVPSPNEGPTAQSKQEKTDNQKSVHFPNFSCKLEDINQFKPLEKPYFEK